MMPATGRGCATQIVPAQIRITPMPHRAELTAGPVIEGHVGTWSPAAFAPRNHWLLNSDIRVEHPHFDGTGWIRSHQSSRRRNQRSPHGCDKLEVINPGELDAFRASSQRNGR